VVTVEEVRTEHHWHTDSIERIDTLFREKTTTIMRLDSSQMAMYGIKLKTAEQAWLVQNKELEQRIQQLKRMTADRYTVRDSIPMPYPVEKIVKVEKPLTWWQRLRMMIGGIVLVGLSVIATLKLVSNKFL
jgi:hypothetical protein